MKTEYQYLRFELIETKPKTTVWGCLNKKSGTKLGEVKWYGPWRQYCYFPLLQAVYNNGCLADIQDFIDQL